MTLMNLGRWTWINEDERNEDNEDNFLKFILAKGRDRKDNEDYLYKWELDKDDETEDIKNFFIFLLSPSLSLKIIVPI